MRAALTGSFIDHVGQQRKHEHIQACESQKHGLVGEVVEDRQVVEAADAEECCQGNDQRRQEAQRREIHAGAQNQLSEAQRVLDWFDVAFADSSGVADRCEFNGVAIAQQADGDGGRKAETIGKQFEKIE